MQNVKHSTDKMFHFVFECNGPQRRFLCQFEGDFLWSHVNLPAFQFYKIFCAFNLCWGRVDGCPPPIFRSPVYTPWATSLKTMTLKLGEDLGSRNLIRYLTWIQNEFEEKQRSKDVLWSIRLAFHLTLTSSFKCLQLLPLHIGFKFTPKMTQLQFMTYSWTQLCGFIHYYVQTYLVWVVVWH